MSHVTNKQKKEKLRRKLVQAMAKLAGLQNKFTTASRSQKRQVARELYNVGKSIEFLNRKLTEFEVN